MDTLQFYPTPAALARQAWRMFEKDLFGRVLEPSAGRGHLLSALIESEKYRWRNPIGRVDVIEINVEHHPVLREKGFHVVDVDFLNHRSSISYDAIIMNPPFRNGVDHVLHAWDLLKDGELVAIINAETVRNPNSAKRKHLLNLIEEYGRVEFVQSAFEDPDTLRRTAVEVALVHMKKATKIELPDFSTLMREDDREDIQVQAGPLNELALPDGTIKNTVRAFQAAVEAMKQACIAEATANYYAALIAVKKNEPQDDSEHTGKQPEVPAIRFGNLQKTINERYDALKEKAWRKVLEATEFTSRFTNKVREDIEGKLNELVTMEFTVQNIYALLDGLIASRSELDMQMLEDVFDKITRYTTVGNRAYYHGWKSNDAHRLGWKIKKRRFILPHMAASFTRDVSWDACRLLDDIDRAFAFLDGKTEPMYAMSQSIERHKDAIASRQRISSDYFDIRFFSGAGTMHFFPKRQDLLDRLNLLVGQRRQWIPDNFAEAPAAFREQYEKADKVTQKMEAILANNPHWWRTSNKELAAAYEKGREASGVSAWDALSADEAHPQLPLLDEPEQAA